MVEPARLEPSEELRSIVMRYWAAFRRGDADAIVARHSAAHGITVIGTDPTEFIDDPERLALYVRRELSSLDDWPGGDEAEVGAWAEGSVGWAVVRSTIGVRDDSRGLRMSLVFHLERDEWRIVHEHWSVGVSNEEVIGVRLPIVEEVARVVAADPPDLGAMAAADGTITLIFTDIEESTLLTATYGDRGWIEVLRAHNAIMEEATIQQGGTVVQRVGDGYMLVFPSARRALRAALGIQSGIGAAFNDPGSPIRVRIGIHTGDVIREADEFFGQAVNYAARVAAAAAGGETLVSKLVRDLVADDREFAFAMPRGVSMKGFSGEQTVYPLVGPRPAV